MIDDHAPLPRETLRLAACAALLVAALVLGGGQGGLGDLAVQWLSLPLLAWTLASSDARARLFATWRSPGWLVLLFVGLPLLQLLPLPESLWLLSPERRRIAGELARAGLVPAHRVALSPTGAERALLGLVPAVSLYLAALVLPLSRQRLLVALVVVVALASLLLGMAQLAQGPDSALRLYSHTNRSEAVGFFANRNHLADLFLMCLPLGLAAIGQALSERARGRERRLFVLLALAACTALLVLGLALTRSRAGLGLGLLGMLAALPLSWRASPGGGGRRVVLLAGAAAVVLVLQFGAFGLMQRFHGDAVADQRGHILEVTLQAARGHMPFGSGLGGFRSAFQAADTDPADEIVNHAHDDWAELWLEGGWPAAAFALAFLAVFARAAWRAWRPLGPGDSRSSRLWPRAASLAAVLALLHSAVDYPLRPTANEAVFALLLAIVFSNKGTR